MQIFLKLWKLTRTGHFHVLCGRRLSPLLTTTAITGAEAVTNLEGCMGSHWKWHDVLHNWWKQRKVIHEPKCSQSLIKPTTIFNTAELVIHRNIRCLWFEIDCSGYTYTLCIICHPALTEIVPIDMPKDAGFRITDIGRRVQWQKAS